MSDDIYNHNYNLLSSWEEFGNLFTNDLSIPENTSKILGTKTKNPGNKKVHDNNYDDNLLRKIQIHFYNFIILFLNDIFKVLNINLQEQFLSGRILLPGKDEVDKFHKIEHDIKKIVNKKMVQNLKEAKVKDILKYKISPKYKKFPSDNNKQIYEEVLENNIDKELVEKIFSLECLLLFKNIYYRSYKLVNLKELGIEKVDKVIILSKNVKMFQDLLKKNEKKGKTHVINIHKCAIKNFLPGYIFYYSD